MIVSPAFLGWFVLAFLTLFFGLEEIQKRRWLRSLGCLLLAVLFAATSVEALLVGLFSTALAQPIR